MGRAARTPFFKKSENRILTIFNDAFPCVQGLKTELCQGVTIRKILSQGKFTFA